MFGTRKRRARPRPLLRRAFLLASAGALAFGRASGAEDTRPAFRLIVHPDNRSKSVSRVFAERAFLKNVHEWQDGQAIRPVDLPADSPVRRAFSKSVLRRSVEAVKSYWQQRIFSGRGIPPPELATDAAVVEYVLSHRGALGYVGPDAELGRARPIAVQ